MRTSHVVIVTNLFPNSQEKEKGQFILQLVEHLKHHLHITVISPIPFFPKIKALDTHSGYKYSQITKYERKDGYDVHFCRHLTIPKMGFATPFTLLIPLLLIIKKINKVRSIDLINAHWVFPDGVASSWIGNALQCPVILSARGCDINYYPSLFGRKVQIGAALRSCKGITAVSEDLKMRMINMGISKDKIKIIPNGINFDKFKIRDRIQCRKRLNTDINGKIVLFIGSLDEVKAVHFLIRAFSKLEPAVFDLTRLWIVGNGHLRADLEKLSIKLDVIAKIKFWGSQNHDIIPLLLGAANVLCLSSIREGRPNVLLEALASGLPVVASRVGGIPELIFPGENGFLFEVGNVKSFSDFICQSLLTKWDRTLIRKTVSYLSWEKSTSMYLEAYSRILFDKNIRY